MMRMAYGLATASYVGVLCLIVGRFAQLSYTAIAILTFIIAGYLVMANPVDANPPNQPIATTLESIRIKYKLPALGGAIFNTEGLVDMAAVGVRKSGDSTPVTKDDLWHLGSDTKVMTAMLAGTFVVEKKLSWNDRVLSYFPDIADKVTPAMREVTIGQVLRHQAGFAVSLDWTHAPEDSLVVQRQSISRLALCKPQWSPGAYHYSNFDYVVIGAILEKITGQSWEELIRERIFTPLGMTSAGFGGLGTVGKIDQPWPHDDKGLPAPMNGPATDNLPFLGPAGTVHCTMDDWSKFLVDQLRGSTGMKALLPSQIYTDIQAPGANVASHLQYGFGWGITDRSWAGGKALTHAGSNTLNYCVCWLAPAKKFGVLVCTNQGGDNAQKATDEAASALIIAYQQKLKDKQ
jgi:CubicO group peptidase (beta-lactamase class C family)